MSTAIYYPRLKQIWFYDENGRQHGWMQGSIARDKFFRLIKAGKFPRISFCKTVKNRGGMPC